jgi:cyanate lyase
MTLNESQATTIDDTLELPAQTLALLQVMPYKVSLTTAAPTDLQLNFFMN